MGIHALIHSSDVDLHRLYVSTAHSGLHTHTHDCCFLPLPHADDSAVHISEETAGAARAAPIAILVAVGATATLGWLLSVATSFAASSIPNLLASPLVLPMGQVFLDVLGKQGMLAIWSLIIVVQYVTGAAQGVDASRVVFAFARDNALPGSRWWKKVHPYTRTPVNAVWLVMVLSAVCGLLGLSETALSAFAGCVFLC